MQLFVAMYSSRWQYFWGGFLIVLLCYTGSWNLLSSDFWLQLISILCKKRPVKILHLEKNITAATWHVVRKRQSRAFLAFMFAVLIVDVAYHLHRINIASKMLALATWNGLTKWSVGDSTHNLTFELQSSHNDVCLTESIVSNNMACHVQCIHFYLIDFQLSLYRHETIM